MHLTHTFTVRAPIAAVWSVLGDDFDDIGAWATAVPDSRRAARPIEIDGAPSAGRTCEVAVPGFSAIDERLTRFEPDRHTLAYEVIAGMPRFVTGAVNTWTLRAAEDRSTAVTTSIEMRTRGLIGLLARPAMRLNLARTQRSLARDLATFVETGSPSEAKQRQLAKLAGR
ncbi:MAG: SRPBCC family protein [Actinomycetota bacterium]